MDVVIGIDPSSRAMHAVVSTEQEMPSAHYMPLHKTDKALANAQAYTWAHELVMAQGLADIYVFVELPVMGRAGAHTMLAIGKAIGAVEAASVHAGGKVIEVNNMTWKSKVIGGRVGKPEINQWVRKNAPTFYAEIEGQQDLCDAYCINTYGNQVVGISKRPALTKQRKIKKRK